MQKKDVAINAVEIYRLGKEDLGKFIALIRLFEDIFEMKNFSLPQPDYLQTLLHKHDFYVFVAMLGDRVVGGLTTYVLEQYFSVKPLAYIMDLVVATEHQRQGIGKRLIEATTRFYTEKGFEEVFVQADKVDVYAIDFYRLTKPTAEEEVVHFYYILNK
ncbi:GNAT family N-acetyltransferase [Pontibacter sp. HSC-14F20]|nr:GNAT family N-acetyltransferase [Pontibacter sp. HSC-14F20]